MSIYKTNQDVLHEFYETEKKNLLESYPGLTRHRLENEFDVLFSRGVSTKKESLGDLFIPHHSHPLESFLNDLRKGRPLEYITGKAYFYSFEISVTEDCLIPRSETELLVESTLEVIDKLRKKESDIDVLDVGTGSGAIALALGIHSNQKMKITGSDISSKALSVAAINEFNLKFQMSGHQTYSWVQSDRLDSIDGCFDIIVSNPPYIMRSEANKNVHRNVDQFEPDSALYLDDQNYFTWFESFFYQVIKKLNNPGFFIMEGHELYINELKKRAINQGMNSSELAISPDLTGRPRFLSWKRGMKNG